MKWINGHLYEGRELVLGGDSVPAGRRLELPSSIDS